MIKTRNLVLLAVVLVVLLGISWLQRSSHERSTTASNETKVIDAELDMNNLSRITVAYGLDGDVVELLSTPTGWIVGSAYNAKANDQRIETLLRNLSGLAGEFRSDSPDVIADYGLDADHSVRIRAFGPGGGEVAAVDVGNSPERLPGNFIKSPDSPAVYLTGASVLSHLGLYDGPARPKSTHFADMQAVQEDRKAIDRIVLVDEGRRLELVKEFAVNEPAPDDTTGAEPTLDRLTWEWKAASDGNRALAKTKVDAVQNALVKVRAVDVDDPSVELEQYGLQPPQKTATLVMEDGSERVFEFGHSRVAEGDHPAGTWMQVQGEPTIWVVTDYAVNNAFKSVDDLLPDE